MKLRGNNAFLFVIVTVTLDLLAFGLFVPVMPEYLKMITGKEGEEAVVYGGLLLVTFGVMNFLVMSLIGNLSDRFGRRPVLLTSNAGLAIDMVIMGLANSMFVLFLGRALAGITSATFSTANSYIADTTEPQERGRAYGMLGAAFAVGFIIGPVIGGILGNIDVRLPFFVAAGVATLNFFYGLFVLPESLAKENRRPVNWARANPFGAFKHFAKMPQVAWFILATGVLSVAHSVFQSTWGWSGEIRFDWSPQEIALSLAAVGLASAIAQAGLSGYATKRFGPSRTGIFGLCAGVLSLLGYAFATEAWMIYTIIAAGAVGGVGGAALQQMMTGVTSKDTQGELQGAIASLNALCALIIGPLLMTQTLHIFSADDAPMYLPGANFLLAAILSGFALIPLYLGIKANAGSLDEMDIIATSKPMGAPAEDGGATPA